MDSGQQLKRLGEKLQEVLKKYELVQKENEKLRSELLPAKQREMGFMEQIAGLERKIMVLNTGAGNLNDADKKELDKKLHVYLKEIDRCISMLSE